MKKTFCILALCGFLSSPSMALEVSVGGISNGDTIPVNFAFCKPDGKGRTENGGNINPQVRWSAVPEGTRSLALIVVDKDVPASFDDANQDGKTIAYDAPRRDFYHWVLFDIPTTITSIKQGQNSSSFQAAGKAPAQTTYGINAKNDYGSFMKGDFGGYDGPCPPWNDERIHNYHFQVYALGVEKLDLPVTATGAEVMAVIAKHTLAMGETVGTYTNYVNAK